MKKHLFLLLALALAFAGTTRAQLVVDSLGRVGIGTTDTLRSCFSVNTGGFTGTTFSIENQRDTGMYLYTNSNSSPITTGMMVRTDYTRNAVGIWSRTLERVNGVNYSVAILGQSGSSNRAAGVMGGLERVSCTSGSGVYGTSSTAHSPNFIYPGVYAGYFQGDLRTTGKLMGTLYTSAVSSSAVMASMSDGNVGEKQIVSCNSYKKNNGESVLERLSAISTTDFLEVVPDDSPTERVRSSLNEGGNVSENTDSKIVMESMTDDVQHRVKTVLRHGVDAEELQRVFPELVAQDEAGNYLVNYVDMVPLLLQSIHELFVRIDELEGNKSVVVQKSKVKAMSMEEEGASTTDVVCMSQNKPNPFSESSVITLNVPENTKSASIYVYDLSGKQVKSIPVNQRGETDITVYASDLQEGMFVYSLVVDGTVVATRRMMVVKN